MLSESEREEIQRELPRYAHKRAMVPEALRIVQEHRGWVNDDGVKDVAETLAMSVDEIETIATAYNMIFRRPVGRHVILLCDNVSCWVMGSEALQVHIAERLHIGPGQTTPDNRFTLIPSACIGDCHEAPAMIVDGEMYGNLTSERIDEILERYP